MRPFEAPHQSVKAKGYEYPQHAAPGRRSHAQFPAALMEREEVDPNRNEHANVKGDPKPDTRRHGRETFTQRATRQW